MAKTKKKVAAKAAKQTAGDTNFRQSYDEFRSEMFAMEKDLDKFEQSHNGAAGSRLRKSAQTIKVLAAAFRKQVQEQKNQLKAAK